MFVAHVLKSYKVEKKKKIDTFFFNDTATTEIYTLSLHDALPIYNPGSITSCYSTGAVTGNDDIGGLSGYNAGSITSCYSTGTVTGDTFLGGLCGGGWEIGIKNCYFLNTAGPDNGFGIDLTDAYMKQQSSFTGWDFIGETTNGSSDFWIITAGEYPSLHCFDVGFIPYSFSGSGGEADPYHISTISDLGAIWQYPAADYILDNLIVADGIKFNKAVIPSDRKSTRLNSSHTDISRMPSSA